MLSRIAGTVVPAFGRLTVTTDPEARLAPGSVVVANHTSLADPAVVLAALHRLGVEPVVLAAAGLWRIPGLGRALTREGFVPVHRNGPRASDALAGAADALADGRIVLIYGEGGIPPRKGSGEAPPAAFRTGVARLAQHTGALVSPLGQVGARRLSSGTWAKQLAGLITAPVRRPALHVHVGAPLRLTGDASLASARVRQAVTAAWRTAAGHVGEHCPIAPAEEVARESVAA
ncbi:lysophospholipid acyltransferase family protein [Streptomyces sp. NPDC058685]|uniref:lysophospholipid acyltransferase family protein n=1 Tax=Streptomyces sp. NPDC058685 TaxID=3346598 RepID=UPI00364BA152